MTEIAFCRRPSEVLAGRKVIGMAQGEGDKATVDGKIKAPTAVGRMWLVGWVFSSLKAFSRLAHFSKRTIVSTVQPPAAREKVMRSHEWP